MPKSSAPRRQETFFSLTRSRIAALLISKIASCSSFQNFSDKTSSGTSHSKCIVFAISLPPFLILIDLRLNILLLRIILSRSYRPSITGHRSHPPHHRPPGDAFWRLPARGDLLPHYRQSVS